MAAPRAVRIGLSESERAELQARLRRRKVARGDALRAEIVLLAAEGLSNLAITARLGGGAHDGGDLAEPVRREAAGRAGG